MASVGRLVKESMVKELSEQLGERRNIFVTSIGRIPASEADALRKRLFASRASLHLVQRRLGWRALSSLQLPGIDGLLEGSLGLVLSGDDVVPVAKLITEFQKAHEEWLSIRGAVVEGQLLDQTRVEQLATIPPRPVLLAQVVGTIESPLADVIVTIERLMGDLAWVVEQAAASRPAASLPAQAPTGETTKGQAPGTPAQPQPGAGEAATSEEGTP